MRTKKIRQFHCKTSDALRVWLTPHFPMCFRISFLSQDSKLWYGIGILYDRYGSLEHAEEAFLSVLRMDQGKFFAHELASQFLGALPPQLDFESVFSIFWRNLAKSIMY